MSRVWSQASHVKDTPQEGSGPLGEFDELETREALLDSGPLVEPGPRRWKITFVIIALLLVAFSLIAFAGLTQSDWLYGNYGEISQVQWEQIAELRERLAQLGIAPEAVDALDDALALPHPSTQDVLADLRRAARALDQPGASAAARQVQSELQALIVAIDPDQGPIPARWTTPTPLPIPTLTPIMGAPVAQSKESLCP